MTITMQEYFNQTVAHLEGQGERAYEDEACAYRVGNGLKCAVGAFIPENHACLRNEIHNTLSVGDLVDKFPDLIKHVIPEYEDAVYYDGSIDHESNQFQLVIDLQDLHDDSYNWDENGFNPQDGILEVIADRFDLKVPNTKDQK